MALAPTQAGAVVGGTASSGGHFPWTVAVVVSGQSVQAGQLCGGTLISMNRVLTAAHCIIDPGTLAQSKPGDLDVVVGMTSKTDLSGATRIPVAAISLHRSADVEDYRYDAAQLTLASGVPEAFRPAIVEPVPPIGAAQNDVPAEPRHASTTPGAWGPGTQSWIFGWGSEHYNGAPSNVLRSATVGIAPKGTPASQRDGRLPDATCSAVHGGNFSADDMLCVGQLDLTGGMADACQGDSGGPLLKRALKVDDPELRARTPSELATEKAAYRTALRNDNRALLVQWARDASTPARRSDWRAAELAAWKAQLRTENTGQIAGWHASELEAWREELRAADPGRVAAWKADELAGWKDALRTESAADIPVWEGDELNLWKDELRADHATDIPGWRFDEIATWKTELLAGTGQSVIDDWHADEIATWKNELLASTGQSVIDDWHADEIATWKAELLAGTGQSVIDDWHADEIATWKNELRNADPDRVQAWRVDELAIWRQELRAAHADDIPGWRDAEIARWKQQLRDTRPADVESWRNAELSVWIDQLKAATDPQQLQDWRDAELSAWVAELRAILPTAAIDSWRDTERAEWLDELRAGYEGELVDPELTDHLNAQIDADPVARDDRLEARVTREILTIIDANPAARDARLEDAVRNQLEAVIDADAPARDARLDAAVDVQLTAVINSDPTARDARLDQAVDDEISTLIVTATAPTRTERLDARVDAELTALIDAASSPTRTERLAARVDTELQAQIDADENARDARLDARVDTELEALINAASSPSRTERLAARVDTELQAQIDADENARDARLDARVDTELEALINAASSPSRTERLAARVDTELEQLIDAATTPTRAERLESRVAAEVEALIDADPEARDDRLEAAVQSELQALIDADPVVRDARLAGAVDSALDHLVASTTDTQPVTAADPADQAVQQQVQNQLIARSETAIAAREEQRGITQQNSYPVNGHHWRLMGISSWGRGCGDARFPGVYTRVGAQPIYDFVKNENPAPMPRLARASAIPLIVGKYTPGGTITCTPGGWNDANSYSFQMWKDHNRDGVRTGNEELIAQTNGVHNVSAADLSSPAPVGCRVEARGPGGYAIQWAPTFTDLQVILPDVPGADPRPPVTPGPPAAGADVTRPLLARNTAVCGRTSCKVSVIAIDRGADASGVESVTGSLTIKRKGTCKIKSKGKSGSKDSRSKSKGKAKTRPCTKTIKKTYRAKVKDDIWSITLTRLKRADKLTLRFSATDAAGNKSSTLRVPIKLGNDKKPKKSSKKAAKKRSPKAGSAKGSAPKRSAGEKKR